ncbi:MAG: GntR family transcriptional regulator [Rhodobacteraceae bacterium]|jgi:DNA-binding GntR family transcriptional regulator|nr:GntR family transcriptional regulator [Paracoccaceae bacterium]
MDGSQELLIYHEGLNSVNLARNRVFQEMRQDILSCRLAPGMELREQDLAQRFGTSKSPVRDAMQKLEREGLVEIAPRQGHRVAPVSMADAGDLIDLRQVLESAAIRLAAERAEEAELRALDRFRSGDTSSLRAYAEYNRAFHSELARLSGNGRIASELARLMEGYERMCVLSLSNPTGPDWWARPLADHNEIIDALQARDAGRAQLWSRRHAARSEAAILRGLRSRAVTE